MGARRLKLCAEDARHVAVLVLGVTFAVRVKIVISLPVGNGIPLVNSENFLAREDLQKDLRRNLSARLENTTFAV